MCEKTETVPAMFEDTYTFNGVEVHVPGLQGHYCNVCDDYTIDYPQAIANQALIAEHRGKVGDLGRGVSPVPGRENSNP
jgi:hypothetical protein